MRWFMLVAAMAFATAHAQDLTNLQLARRRRRKWLPSAMHIRRLEAIGPPANRNMTIVRHTSKGGRPLRNNRAAQCQFRADGHVIKIVSG